MIRTDGLKRTVAAGRGMFAAAALIVGASGHAYGVDQAMNVTGKTVPDAAAAASAEAARTEVMATFLHGPDDGAPGKTVPQPAPKPIAAPAPWPKAVVAVPAELRAAELPSYYIYAGQPMMMRIDPTRIGVKFKGLSPRGESAELNLALGKLGVSIKSATEPGVGNWRILNLQAPLDGEGAVNAVIELILTDPSFEFVSPVFHHASIEGGYYMVTPEINVRVVEGSVDRTDAILREAIKNFEIIEGDLGGLRGARQARAVDRNGFRVLKAANDLWHDARIAWAEPDALSTMQLHFVPNDEFWGFGSMWGWEQNNDIDTDAETAWDLTRGSSSMRVLVMDCGVEQDHPDINQLAGRDFTTGAVGGVVDGGPNTSCDRHGTPVAGIISGRINNTVGGAGVAPNCRTLSAKTATEQTNPCSSSYAAFSGSWLANALAWGQGQNCLISNSSFGVGSSNTIANAYDNAEAAGMIHFVSAGNGGADNIGDPTLGYPASLSSVQAVAAIDADGGRSDFSNYGTGLQFSTPGTNVRSPDRQSTLGYNGNTTANDGDYTTFGGTSAASPFCAGICALIWGAFPDFQPASILSVMKTSARDLGVAGYDTGYGWGFPNADFALRFLGGPGDWCAEAVTITGNSYNPSPFSTTGLNAVPDELQENCELNGAGVGRSKWYRFVPTCSGTIDLNTNGSNYDTVLAVFRGACDSAVQVGCDDDGGDSTQSQITGLSVSAGFTYLIKVSGYGTANAGGTLDFNFAYTPNPPVNDDCADATNIIFTPYTGLRCTLGASGQLCESSESCEAGGVGTSKSVWWAYTPSVNGRVDIDTDGSDYDTVLSVWNGCFSGFIFNGDVFCLGSTQIACDDDSGAGTTSLLVGTPMRKGVTYRVKVSQYGASGAGGDMTLHFNFRRCPADHNLSGIVSVQDIFDFLADYFAGNLNADYNNSGTLSVQDIFDFLAIYFAGECD